MQCAAQMFTLPTSLMVGNFLLNLCYTVIQCCANAHQAYRTGKGSLLSALVKELPGQIATKGWLGIDKCLCFEELKFQVAIPLHGRLTISANFRFPVLCYLCTKDVSWTIFLDKKGKPTDPENVLSSLWKQFDVLVGQLKYVNFHQQAANVLLITQNFCCLLMLLPST